MKGGRLWIHRHETLPPLAWLASLGSEGVTIEIGTGVQIDETQDTIHLVEGAWDGPFGEFGFTEAPTLFGSGLKLRDGRALLAAPCHNLEALYLCETAGRVVASNSLCFLMAQEGIRLPTGQNIWQAMLALSRGKLDQGRVLFDDGTRRVRRFIACNVEVVDGLTTVVEKTASPRFANYAEYSDYLHSTCRAVLDNAADRARTRTYEPLATVSKGYDSSACAAVMAANGCRRAITIAASRRGESDSGRDIAEDLGMSCTEKPRPALSDWQDAEEAEFLASGCGGDSVFLALAEDVPGRVLSTGVFGDELWDPYDPPTNTVTRAHGGGIGLTEFRLRSDFIHAPLCYIGCTRRDDLYRIAQMEEMRPYWVSGPYNRPMARRILETVGIPRMAFGQIKQAVMFMMTTQEKRMSPSLRRLRDDFIRREKGAGTLFLSRLHDVPRKAFALIWQIFGKIPKRRRSVVSKIGSAGRVLAIRLDQAYMRLWPFTLEEDALFLASVEKISARYATNQGEHMAATPSPQDAASKAPAT